MAAPMRKNLALPRKDNGKPKDLVRCNDASNESVAFRNRERWNCFFHFARQKVLCKTVETP